MANEAKIGGDWAQQQARGVATQKHQGDPSAGTPNNATENLSGGGRGESRTPDKTIGQVAHADGQSASKPGKTGGAGDPQTSKLEPEKQGGIGGP